MNTREPEPAYPTPRPLARLLVLGLGGGGCNAVTRMRTHWDQGPEVVAVNTDAAALEACPLERKVQIGKHLTRGLGAGADPAVGKLAAEDSVDLLRAVVSGNDLLLLVATLGGGTGTGAAPLVARLAREEGALVIGFVSLPFAFEGERRKRQAEEGLRLLQAHCDVIVVQPNDRLAEMVPDQTSLAGALEHADRMLGVGILALWRLLNEKGLIGLDFADLRNLVEHSGGVCAFGFGEAAGPDKAEAALASLLDSPLLQQGRVLERSPALLVSIMGDADVSLADVQRLMQRLKEAAPAALQIGMGVSVNPEWQDRLALMVLAAEPQAAGDVAPAPGPAPAPAPAGAAAQVPESARPGRDRPVQESLKFDSKDKGRFTKVIEPTVYNGEDLDIPTFIRRNLKIAYEG